ncbi:MAG: GNAT family N-acetyltransferase [Oscillospiraceae bacterium]
MKIRFEPATLWQVEEMIELHNQAFARDWQENGCSFGYGHSPETMAGLLLTCQAYRILNGEEAVGCLLYREVGEEDFYLESLCVIPSYQGKGVGHLAMDYIINLHPKARHWALMTPADHKANREFYGHHGFVVTQVFEDGGRSMVRMERTPA